ncbi:MAG TPA: dTDP-4-dehydrorhamnose reductase [Trinickia sp.]|uniref:dTDP-4-dehydrorhamnose reductase n=1 Tax=Trinickia sp. TaxID=2571163 RepID=UPI002C2A61F6|nr:dTDP-4-dehydrorhamnose reductase [Trinickia sp.]HVW52313.1 dTDP-4-dehydrorhamnose reductase [Trinickia sp.]
MRLLLIGRSGQLGWELMRSLAPLGNVIAFDRRDADLSAPDRLPALIANAKPDVVVNAAAYTAVDKAESEVPLASTVNADAVGVLARAARDAGALFVHFSTDYVFDGEKVGPYVESDEPLPLNAYGRSKLAGELAVEAAGGDWLVFRTSWIYAARGANFLQTMLRLAHERETLRVVADQQGAPTAARMIADLTAHAIRQSMGERTSGAFESGVFHMTASGSTSWFGFASRIIETLRSRRPGQVVTREIEPIAASEYAAAAARPLNSLLDNSKLERRFGVFRPDWEVYLQLVLDEVLGTCHR